MSHREVVPTLVAMRYPWFTGFIELTEADLASYIAYCRTVDVDSEPDKEIAKVQLRHLDTYERAEKLDLDDWISSASEDLVRYAVMHGRCDIIEKYALIAGPESYWNANVSTRYRPCLYPILHIVMPLEVSIADALDYVKHGLHREVAVHILGRPDVFGKQITLERLMTLDCMEQPGGRVSTYKKLEEIGLDLGDPELTREALEHAGDNKELLAFLRSRIRPVE